MQIAIHSIECKIPIPELEFGIEIPANLTTGIGIGIEFNDFKMGGIGIGIELKR